MGKNSLFEDGDGDFKWLASTKKSERLKYINLMAMSLLEPDEIWWVWVKDHKNDGRWRLKRRYLRAFSIEGVTEFAISVFEWGGDGWLGSTTFMAEPSSEKARFKYFDKQRNGRLVYMKK